MAGQGRACRDRATSALPGLPAGLPRPPYEGANSMGALRREGECTRPGESATLPNCIVCNTPNVRRHPGADFSRFDCDRCGSFALSGSAEVDLPEQLDQVPLRRSLMSHTLRRMQQPDGAHLHIIRTDDLPSFWRQDRLPTPQQQADALIFWTGDHQPAIFEFAEIAAPALAALIGLQIAPRGDGGGLGWLFDQLKDRNLFKNTDRGSGRIGLMLTMDGWEKYEDLRVKHPESRTAFMAMKFNDIELGRVVAECFKPAVSRAGFTLRLLTDEQPAGLIDNQLRAAIIGSRFLISDLTYGNQGAYWEAGFAEGLGLPVIYTCKAASWAASKTHFDTNHMVTIVWDPGNLMTASNELTATIRATLRAEAKQTDD